MRYKILGLLVVIIIVTSACMSAGKDEVKAEQTKEVREIIIQTVNTPDPTPYPDFDLEHLSIIRTEEETESDENSDTSGFIDSDYGEGNSEEFEETEGAEIYTDLKDSEIITEPEEIEYSREYIGEYTITFYCPCPACCGEFATGYTASGTLATEGRTVACDLPFGTVLEIEGLGIYIVEDRGVEGNQIDIFVNDHQTALNLGMQYRNVWILEE